MTEPRSHDLDGQGPVQGRGESPPGAPRWVKVTAVVVLALALLVVVALLVGGEHGPARHSSLGEPITSEQLPAAAADR
jgi:hypothetical protein